MARSHLEEPVTKAKAAVALAQGATGRSVAQQFDSSDSAVSEFKKRNAGLIEHLQQMFIAKALPNAMKTATRLIKQYSEPKARNALSYDVRNHAHQHTMEALRAAGVYSGNQSVSIGKLTLNDNSQNINIETVPDEELFDRLMALK